MITKLPFFQYAWQGSHFSAQRSRQLQLARVNEHAFHLQQSNDDYKKLFPSKYKVKLSHIEEGTG
jgi:hypothetical protein